MTPTDKPHEIVLRTFREVIEHFFPVADTHSDAFQDRESCIAFVEEIAAMIPNDARP